MIRNDSSQDVPRYGVLGIDRPVIGPGDNEQAFKNRIVLSGVTPDVDRHTGRFAILAEPLKKGKIGRAFVTGVCPVKIKIAADSSGSGSSFVPSSSEPAANSSTVTSSSVSSSGASSSSGSQLASSSSASTSRPSSSGTTSGSGSHLQSSASSGSGPSGVSGSASPGSSDGSGGGGSSDGGSGGGGSGGGGSGGGGSGGGGSGGTGSGSNSTSSSSNASSDSEGELFFHLSPCEDDSDAKHNLYIRASDIPQGDDDCVPLPSSSSDASGSGSGSGQGSGGGSGGGGSGGSGGGGSGDGGSGGSGGSGEGSGSDGYGSGASGSDGSGSGSQFSGTSSDQSSASGSGSQSSTSGQGSGGSGGSGDGSSGGHGHNSSGSTTAQPVAGPLFMADIADQETGHLIPCPYGTAAVLWADEPASSEEKAVWAIVRLDGGLTVGQPFLTQIAVADGSSGNCEVPANWTYTVHSLRGDLLDDRVPVLKPRALGKTAPNTQGYGMAVRVLDGDQAALKLWDAGELADYRPCVESSSSGTSGTSSASDSSASGTTSGSASSSIASSSSTPASSSGSASGSASASGSPDSGSGSQSISAIASGAGGSDVSGSGGSGGSGDSGGGSGGGSGGSGGGSGGGDSGSSSGSASTSGSPSASPGSSSSSGEPPPTTIKYNGKCYSYNYASGVYDLPSDAQVISPGEWWADCDGCKATCCASHNTVACKGCFSSNSKADMSMEVTEIYTDGSPKVHWKAKFSGAPIWCNNAQWGYDAGEEGNNAHYEYDQPTGTWNPTTRKYDYTYSTVTCDNFNMNGGIGGNNTDWGISVWACKGYPGDGYGTIYGPLFAGKGDCKGIHETVTEDIKFFGPNPDWNPDDPDSPMEIEMTVGTRTVKYDITIKNNTCCKDDTGHCQNRGQGQTHCDGGCVEEPPLP